jgi:SAM-dependent methyltransferase
MSERNHDPLLRGDRIRQHVRRRYGEIALAGERAAGGCGTTACCGSADDLSARLGYSGEELSAAPDGANLGLGCGNPQAIAELMPGEIVLDLGSGAGFDCFLAARKVGEAGRVIGVDMTPEMVARARANAAKGGFNHVEFRLGEIEHLPVADQSVDVIISNCVINLSPDKAQVFREAYRVLKPGGRLAVSDIVRVAELPPEIRDDPDAYAACVSGASPIGELRRMLEDSGFDGVSIEPKAESGAFIRDWLPGTGIENSVVSAFIRAVKPAKETRSVT